MTRRKRLVIVAAVLCLAVVGVVARATLWPSWRLDPESMKQLKNAKTLADVEQLLGRPGTPAIGLGPLGLGGSIHSMTREPRPCLRWDDGYCVVEVGVDDAGRVDAMQTRYGWDEPLWRRLCRRVGL